MKNIYLLLFSILIISCHKEEEHTYTPMQEVDIVNGDRTAGGTYHILVKSYSKEDVCMDFVAAYDTTKLGKLTFRIDPKFSDTEFINNYFNGKGEAEFAMSLSRTDDHFDTKTVHPIFMDKNGQKNFRVRFRLKGELHLNSAAWYIDYAYVVLSSSFQPDSLETSEDIFMCKSNTAFLDYYQMEGFNTMPRAGTFDISYDRYVSFNELYFNIFCNITGLEAMEIITLKLDKESFFEIYVME